MLLNLENIMSVKMIAFFFFFFFRVKTLKKVALVLLTYFLVQDTIPKHYLHFSFPGKKRVATEQKIALQ